MIELRNLTDDSLVFVAAMPGIRVPIPNGSYRTQRTDQKDKRVWCEQQGWIAREDFMEPGQLGGPWWFRNPEQQMQFAMRWA